MNCPSCEQRNPSTAERCLHCGNPLPQNKETGFFAVDEDSVAGMSTNTIGTIFVVVFVVGLGGYLFLFGFDQFETECTTDPQEWAAYEAAPEWNRARDVERRRKRAHRDEQRGDRQGTTVRFDRYRRGERCFTTKTGRVDGYLEKEQESW